MNEEADKHADPTRDDVAIEYNTLRSEILQRIGLRYQFISMTLTIAGVFLGFGVTDGKIALIYPPLAAFLAMAWLQNELRIQNLATYIRLHLEPLTPNLEWETYLQAQRDRTKGTFFSIFMSYTGILMLTQIMAIVIGCLNFHHEPIEWALLGIDLVAVLVILIVTWAVRRSRTTNEPLDKASFAR